MNPDQSREYKARVADYYSRRSINYDSISWHTQIARKLVDLSGIYSGAQVLDLCTGTGMVAVYAASKIGPEGSVLGVDLSEGMLKQARDNAITAGISNVRFEVGDVENLGFAPNSYDCIFCGSAFIWMTDLPAALVHWKELLKPNGQLGLHAFSENAFVTGVVAQSVLSKYGVDYQMSKPTGSIEKCNALLERAGYRNIHIEVDASSAYISIEEAKSSWVSVSHPAPGQFPHPLSKLTPAQLISAQAQYDKELETLNTDKGIVNDMTTFYVYGEK
jgi:ubiquinone/menaquinone biosynthesis C-methylase UbiE